MIDVELAERRNLVMRNAIEGNEWATSQTLVCAYQMILPGEVAPSHRHTSNALRFIIDGRGTYSVVNGQKMPMETGDVVLTPGGHWHGHGHDGDEPAYWLDCLDVPMTYLLEPMYCQPHPAKFEGITATVRQSPYRFSREMIAQGLADAIADPENKHGARMTLPTPSMPSVGLTVERLSAGADYREHRSSANRIFAAMEGSGTCMVDGRTIHWSHGDTFLVPSSYWARFASADGGVLLEISDAPLMRFVNHLRVEFR